MMRDDMRAKDRSLAKRAAQYYKFVEWSEEDECFIGRCPTLFSGGVHGEDEARVYAKLCEVAEEWVALLEREAQVLPKADVSFHNES
jgi:predicted RNase H-like HicB family nuclease